MIPPRAKARPEGHTSISSTVTHMAAMTMLHRVLPPRPYATRGQRLGTATYS